MTELKKTGLFVIVALVLMSAALWGSSSRTGSEAYFNDQGKPFFPNFKDPLECTSLEVIDYNADLATPLPFKVMLKDGKWVIPSHYDYPADAKDRLARTASGVIDLKKDTIRSDRAEDHEALGVIDPLDTKSTSIKGRGKRVTLRNKSDEVLADFIIGKEVPNHPDQRFVRVPGQKRTYGVNVKVDLSTKFSDWVETNLLKLDASRIRRVTLDRYRVSRGYQKLDEDVVTIERKDASSPWQVPDLKPDQEPNTEKLSAMTSALADLKLLGVRPKPKGLDQDIKQIKDTGTMKMTNAVSLQSRGFLPTPNGDVLATQGEARVETDEGIRYVLRFGEVIFASGEALSAGSEEEAKGQDTTAKKNGPKKSAESTEGRFVFISAEFDPTLIPEPTPPPTPTTVELPDDPILRDPDDPKRVAEEKALKEKDEQRKADRERKLKEGRDRAEELAQRFADWYYVISGESYRSIMLDRDALARAKVNPPNSNFELPKSQTGR
jgi:hypothetical protein